MKKILPLLIVLATPVVFAKTSRFESKYSVISEKECKTEKREADFIELRCPSHDGYAVFIDSSEGSAWLSLIKGKLKIQPDVDLAGLKIREPQTGPIYVDGEKLEWRYRLTGSKKTLVGLIYRIGGWENLSLLHVVRVDGAKFCQLGVVKTNEEARALVDGNHRCSGGGRPLDY
ncbi:MAG: hypothetical protein Q7T11_03155 [Deltaproteobacteria bacterium]|nr:hypothetical protein [Deltaproteobacteria bacterium]